MRTLYHLPLSPFSRKVRLVLAEKRLQLMHDLLPKARSIAMLVNPTSPVAEAQTRDAQAAARALALNLIVVSAVSENDFDQVFETLVQQRVDALLVSADPFFSSRREHFVALAARHAIPTMYEFREFVEVGGLIARACGHGRTAGAALPAHTLERAMAVALVPREDNAFANDNPPPARNAVLARYRQLREISKKHHHDILKLISGDAMLQQARRLGLVQGRTLILDDMEEMNYVFDLPSTRHRPAVRG